MKTRVCLKYFVSGCRFLYSFRYISEVKEILSEKSLPVTLAVALNTKFEIKVGIKGKLGS